MWFVKAFSWLVAMRMVLTSLQQIRGFQHVNILIYVCACVCVEEVDLVVKMLDANIGRSIRFCFQLVIRGQKIKNEWFDL